MKNTKSIISVLLACMMIVSMIVLPVSAETAADTWDGTATTAWYTGNASSYTLTTAEEVAGLAQLVNAGNEFSGITINLGADLILNDVANYSSWGSSAPANKWTPIGNYISSAFKKFAGTFDGGDHTIYGLYIDGATQGVYYAGFFGCPNNTIQNINFENAYVIAGSNGSGIVGGGHSGGTALTYENVNVIDSYLKVRSNNGTGAIHGRTGSVASIDFTNCNVIDTEISGSGQYVGSIFGFQSGGSTKYLTFTNCYSNAYVQTSSSRSGGLMGGSNAGHATSEYVFDRCCFAGTMIGGGNNIGGFLGTQVKGASSTTLSITITASAFVGEVKGTNSVGALIGCLSHHTWNVLIENTLAYGTVTTTSTSAAGQDIGAAIGLQGESYTLGNTSYTQKDNFSINNFYYDLVFETANSSDTFDGISRDTKVGSFAGNSEASGDANMSDLCVYYTPYKDVTSKTLGTGKANTIEKSRNDEIVPALNSIKASMSDASWYNEIFVDCVRAHSGDSEWFDSLDKSNTQTMFVGCNNPLCSKYDLAFQQIVADAPVDSNCRCETPSWTTWITLARPTCTAAGSAYRTCAGCHGTETKTLPAAHLWGEWSVTTPATCTTDGEMTRTCTECSNATETKPVAAAHGKTLWVVIKEATETAQGEYHLVCSVCEEVLETKITDKIPTEPVVPEVTYTDIAGHKYEADIKAVTEAGLFEGIGDDKFAPDMTMTRGMIVTVLARLAKVDVTAYANTFTDVAADSYYAPYVGWAQAAGITNGMGDGTFCPDDEITREQAITMIARYLKYINNNDTTSDKKAEFTDAATVSVWAKESVAELIRLGIVEAGEETLRPTTDATRAELANFFANVLEYLK